MNKRRMRRIRRSVEREETIGTNEKGEKYEKKGEGRMKQMRILMMRK